jgi:dynein heavy chain 1
VSAGNVKRDRIQKIKETLLKRGDATIDEGAIAENLPEQEILVQSVCETMVPKLVAEDIPLLFSLLSDVFPGVSYTRSVTFLGFATPCASPPPQPSIFFRLFFSCPPPC